MQVQPGVSLVLIAVALPGATLTERCTPLCGRCLQVKFYEVPEGELENMRNDFK